MADEADLLRDVAAIQQKLYQASDIAEIEGLLLGLTPLLSVRDSDVSKNAYHALEHACRELQKASLADSSVGESLLVRHLLPHLLTDNAPSSAEIPLMYCRRTLADWINQYSERERDSLRSRVLDRLAKALRISPSENACWTVSAIGYRRNDLTAAFWNIIDHEQEYSDLGDTALRVLSGLGYGSKEQSRLLSAVHLRMRSRITVPLVATLSELADPSSLHEVLRWWLQPDSKAPIPDVSSLALNVLVSIASAPGTRVDVQDSIWSTIVDLFERAPARFGFDIYLGGGIVPHCDTPQVIPSLLRWLPRDAGDADDDMYRRYLLYLRSSECVRQRQLEGWKQTPPEASLNLLRRDALRDTQFGGGFTTSRSMNKEQAWRILLLLGYSPALTWFDEAVGRETSAYVRGHIEDLLACFRLDPLPERVSEWIQQEIDLDRSNASEELAYRLGAVRLAQSAASWTAFDALLNFGFTWSGETSQDSGAALASVAIARVRMGDTNIVTRLLSVALDDSAEPRHHLVAIVALQGLSAIGQLSSEEILQLEPLLVDELRSLYERALVVNIVGHVSPAQLKESTRTLLIDWASARSDTLGIAAMEALARNDVLPALPDLMSNRLGLRKDGNHWALATGKPRSEYAAGIIGLLYWKHPEQFVSAIATLLEETDPFSTARTLPLLLWLLEDKHGEANSSPLPPVIRDALIRQARGDQQAAFAQSAELFEVLAHLAPDALAQESWSDHWHTWHPQTRIALADALGRAVYAEQATQEQAVILLLMLARDARFDVRRSAFRSLTLIAPETLLTICQSWADAPYSELRLRAAEASSWLLWPTSSSGDSSLRRVVNALWRALSKDRDRSVREAMASGREDNRRRAWADQYWKQVREAAEAIANMPNVARSNAIVLVNWPYAHALASVGDDNTLANLDRFLSQSILLPHVRHWLRRLRKETEEQWKKVTGKWPEPGFAWEGELEYGRASMSFDNENDAIQGSLALWRAPSLAAFDGPGTKESALQWGGAMRSDGRVADLPGRHATIKLADGRIGHAHIARITHANSKADVVVVMGQGSYPT